VIKPSYQHAFIPSHLLLLRVIILVNPRTASALDDLLHSEEVERAYIRFVDGSIITIGEVDNRGRLTMAT